jgi:hypothetical protein
MTGHRSKHPPAFPRRWLGPRVVEASHSPGPGIPSPPLRSSQPHAPSGRYMTPAGVALIARLSAPVSSVTPSPLAPKSLRRSTVTGRSGMGAAPPSS